MSVVKRLATAAKPNGSTYAAPYRKVYVSDTLGKAVAVVDVDNDEIIKTLGFNSETGMPQYDSVARKVYVNLRSTNQIAEIDPSTDAVVKRYPVQGCEFNHGMAVDSERHRAFLLCGKSRTMTVFALDKHDAIAHLPLPSGADVVKFDPGLRRITLPAPAASLLFIRKTMRSIFEKSKTSRSRRWYTVLRWIPPVTVCTLRSSRKMVTPWLD